MSGRLKKNFNKEDKTSQPDNLIFVEVQIFPLLVRR
jgi:hypothetical protein